MPQSRPPIRANGIGDILGGRGSIILIALIGLFIYWQSNQKEVPFAPGKKQFNTLSIEQEVKLGQQSYLQILQQEQSQGNTVLCADEASCQGDARVLTEKVRGIGERLQRAALELENDYRRAGYDMPGVVEQFNWTYYVVDSATPNAFCLPGGYVAVYTSTSPETMMPASRWMMSQTRTSLLSSWAMRSATHSPITAPRG